MEVESIIFDSKVRKISAFGKLEDCSIKRFAEELVQERDISGFQEKVDKVNEEIEAGLTNVERMIEELKKKKVAQSQIQSKVKAAERLQKLEKEFADRRAEEIARHQCEE